MVSEFDNSAAKKQTSAFPSGLSRGWQLKNANKKPTGSQKKDVQSLTSASECGGLADEDVLDTAPPADLYGKERIPKRTNEVRVDFDLFFFELNRDNSACWYFIR